MDNKEKQILRELDINSRRSISKIAREVHMNKETVNYSIKRLEEREIIKGYFSLIDYFKLGLNLFKVLVRYKDLGETGESRIINWLKKRKEVAWVGKTGGNWDLIFTVRERSLDKLYGLLIEFNKTFGVNIQKKQLLISYEYIWLNEKYLYEENKLNYLLVAKQTGEIVELDKIDEKIVWLLENNARMPITKIASEIGLTAEAAAKRIKSLIKKKILCRFKLRMNLDKINKGYHHIFISLRDFSKLEDMISYYQKSEKCVFLMKYLGGYDLHLEFVSDSESDFREIIKELREKFGESVSDYQQLTILQDFKLS